MKKRTLALLLTLVLCLGLLPTAARAEGPEEPQITWLTLAEGEVPWDFISETNWLILGGGDGIDGVYHPAIDMKTGERLAYDYVDHRVSDGLICVGNDAGSGNFQFGYINVSGEVVIPLEYDVACAFSEGLARVQKDEKWGFVDTTGALCIPCQYEYVDDFSEGLACIQTGPFEAENSVGFIDKTGKVVIPCIYRGANGFFDGVAVVYHGNESSLIDKTGNEIASLTQYGSYCVFSEGLAKVEKDGKQGFIDVTGEEVIPSKYNFAYEFSEGLAAVELNGKWGFIDTAGKEALPFQYDNANSFLDGLALVTLNDQWGFIDKTGEMVVSLHDFDTLPVQEQGLILIVIDGKYGFLDTTGEEVIPLEYDNAYFLGGSMVAVCQGDQWGIFDCTVPAPQPTALTKAMFTVDTADVTHTGSAITKAITSDLVPDTDYTVTYADNTAVGTAKITIQGIGDYTGTLTYTFTIKAAGGTSSSGGSTSSGGGSTSSGGSSSGGSSSSGSSGGSTSTPATPVEPAKPAEPETPVELETPATPASEVYGDVEKDSWYEAGVTFVTDKGLFQGVSEGVFAPADNMTRAMLMTVLARLGGQETAGGDTWYAKGMDWAKEQGISDGTAPESNVSREQLVVMLYRYAKTPETEGDLTAFADGNDVSDWAQAAMMWATSQGILTGKQDARLDPQGTATRAEVAAIIQRFMEKMEK